MEAGVALSQPHRRTCLKSRADYYNYTYYNYNSLTLPRGLIGSIANGQAGSKLLEQRGGYALGEDVGVL